MRGEDYTVVRVLAQVDGEGVPKNREGAPKHLKESEAMKRKRYRETAKRKRIIQNQLLKVFKELYPAEYAIAFEKIEKVVDRQRGPLPD